MDGRTGHPVPPIQFHDFATMVANWTGQDGTAAIAPPLVQPVAPADLADVLTGILTGEFPLPWTGRRGEEEEGETVDLLLSGCSCTGRAP